MRRIKGLYFPHKSFFREKYKISKSARSTHYLNIISAAGAKALPRAEPLFWSRCGKPFIAPFPFALCAPKKGFSSRTCAAKALCRRSFSPQNTNIRDSAGALSGMKAVHLSVNLKYFD